MINAALQQEGRVFSYRGKLVSECVNLVPENGPLLIATRVEVLVFWFGICE